MQNARGGEGKSGGGRGKCVLHKPKKALGRAPKPLDSGGFRV